MAGFSGDEAFARRFSDARERRALQETSQSAIHLIKRREAHLVISDLTSDLTSGFTSSSTDVSGET